MKRKIIVGGMLTVLLGMSACDLFEKLGGLSVPENFSATKGTVIQKIIVTWDAIPNIEYVGYSLERSADNVSFTNLGFVESPYTEERASDDTNVYYYRMKAIKSYGEGDWIESDYTAVVSGYIGVLAEKTLTNNVWTIDSFAEAGQVQWYSYDAISNSIYTLYWDDRTGSGTYPGTEILVSVYKTNKVDSYFIDAFVGYLLPRTITNLEDKLYVKVRCATAGNFAIKVSNH